MSALPQFGPLGERDSLVARIESVWNLRPTVVEVVYGFDHPDDDSLIDWSNPQMLDRLRAAEVLREARGRGWKVEKSQTGYSIQAGPNPAWRYA